MDRLFIWIQRRRSKVNIYNASNGNTEIYDLNIDPEETKNIVHVQPEQVECCLQCLVEGVQYQNKFMEEAINAKGNNETKN